MDSADDRAPKAVVTGGCGFVGSFVVDELSRRGWRTLVLDVLLHGQASIIPDERAAKIVKKDIRDITVADLSGFENAHWIHLAALPFIPNSFDEPAAFFETNTLGTNDVCRLAIATSARRFVHVSTCEVYAADNPAALGEDAPLDPLSPYANSKLGAEVVVARYRDRLNPTTVRLFNAYGPRVTYPYFIPEMIRQALYEPHFTVGALNTFRDFTYAADVARGLVDAVILPGVQGQVLNIGSGHATSMDEVLSIIREVTNTTQKAVRVDSARIRPPGRDPRYFSANVAKAKALLEWSSSIELRRGLEMTAAELGRLWTAKKNK